MAEPQTQKYVITEEEPKSAMSDLNKGHRQRLKDRFLEHPETFSDSYELLELLLTYSIPQKDVKPLAKRLLMHFNSTDAILFAPNDLLLNFKDVKQNTVVLFKLFRALYLQILRQRITKDKGRNDWLAVLDYCSALVRKEVKERFFLILLDADDCIIDIIEMDKGSVNEVNISPREVLEVLLRYHAISFALFHNHPSGFTLPSNDDLGATKEIKRMAGQVNIMLYDHFIFGPNGEKSSFRQLGYL